MNTIFNLIKLGLDEKQAKIYLAGLKTGPTTATVLAKNSEVKRGTIYGILKELKLLGLCSESILQKRKIFTMSDPNQLKAIQNDRDNILNDLLPLLRSFTVSKNIPKISIFEGLQEIKEVYSDTLTGNVKEILTIEAVDSLIEHLGLEFLERYIKQRIKLKIPVRVLATESHNAKHYKQRDLSDIRQTKFIPKKFTLGLDIEIYKNKVLLVSLSEKSFAVLIEDDKISKSLKSIFNYIWETL